MIFSHVFLFFQKKYINKKIYLFVVIGCLCLSFSGLS